VMGHFVYSRTMLDASAGYGKVQWDVYGNA
jgi:hypothetical protein